MDSLAREDLAPATLRGYRYDLRHFLVWHATVQPDAFALDRLAEFELIAYRQHMVAAGRRPATINRRLDALRRLCRWARGTGTLSGDVARDLRPVRTVRNRQPIGLTDPEVHALLRAAGASTHGFAARNYALAQVMLQAGLRVGEVAALRVADITLSDRSGTLVIREHTSDTHGFTEHLFGLCALLGIAFMPRLKDLPDQVLTIPSGSYFQSPRRRADIAPEPVMA